MYPTIFRRPAIFFLIKQKYKALENHPTSTVPSKQITMEGPHTSLLVMEARRQRTHSAAETKRVASPKTSTVEFHWRCPADDTVTTTDIETPENTRTTKVAFCQNDTYRHHISSRIHSHSLISSGSFQSAGANINPISTKFVQKMCTVHGIGKIKIPKMVKNSVTERTQTERAFPIIFASKTLTTYDSA